MTTIREVRHVSASRPTIEGAGVQLRRAFGHGQEDLFDPFLMLDDFRGDHPSQYEAGFPWHPHRGIETITYILEGEVDHGDSMGNSGTIGPGDVQWMTAGSGIIHQEMPRGDARGRMGGFQLWANLPATQKMIDPRYRGITAGEIPVEEAPGVRVRVICGTVGASTGPVREVVIEPEYLDVTLEPGTDLDSPRSAGAHGLCVPVRGRGPLRRVERPHRRRTRHDHPARRRGPGVGRRGRFGSALPARERQASARAHRLARPHRHEHPGGTGRRLARAGRRHLRETQGELSGVKECEERVSGCE